MMIFRTLEPRSTAIAITIMSVTLFSLLRRGSSFRTSILDRGLFAKKSPAPKHPFDSCNCVRSTRKSALGSKTNPTAVGPDGTPLPEVLHRVVGADELKVRREFSWLVEAVSYDQGSTLPA